MPPTEPLLVAAVAGPRGSHATSPWEIPALLLNGTRFSLRMDTQAGCNLLPASLLEKLSADTRPALDTSLPAPTLVGFDHTISTAATLHGRVILPVHLLAHVKHHGEAVPHVFERIPSVEFWVASGIGDTAYVGHPTLSLSTSPFKELNTLITSDTTVVLFPKAPSLTEREPPPKLASSTAYGHASVLHAAPHDMETNSTLASDHPVFDGTSPTPTSLEAIRTWTEVTGCEFEEMREPLVQLLYRFRHVFGPIPAASESRLPRLTMALKAGTTPNPEGKYRRCPPAKYASTEAAVLKFVSVGLIEEITGQPVPADFHRNALVIVPKFDDITGKPTGEVRVTLDARYFNRHNADPSASVLPSVTNFADAFKGCGIFSVADFAQWFFQFRLDEMSKNITGFELHHPNGTVRRFRYLSAPQGWASLPGIAQQHLCHILEEISGDTPDSVLRVYIDNLALGTLASKESLRDPVERKIALNKHLQSIESFLGLCERYHLRIKQGKTRFFQTTARSLGLIFDGTNVKLDDARISDWLALDVPAPSERTIDWLRATLGMFNWFRGMLGAPTGSTPADMFTIVHGFREAFSHLNDVVTEAQSSGAQVRSLWRESHTAAFRRLRDLVAAHGVRVIPDYSRPFFMRTDASLTGWAALLLQADPITGALQLVSCHCGRFTDAAQTQKVNHREAFAVVMGVRSLGDLLDCIDYTLQTDHANVLYWHNSKDPVMRRWWIEFARTNPPIQHIPGESNTVADALSRSPTPATTPSRPAPTPNLVGGPFLIAAISPLLPAHTDARALRAAARSRAGDATPTVPTVPALHAPPAPAAPPLPPTLTQLLDLRLSNRSDYPDTTFSAASWLRTVYTAQIEHMPQLQQENATFNSHPVLLSVINDTQVYTINGRVLVPTEAQHLVLDVLARAHDSAGHPGCGQTAQNLRSIHLEHKMATIEKYVKSCPACQHAKAPGDPGKEGSMSSILPLSPWTRIIVDYVGPLPESPDHFKYVISMTDTFTRVSYWRATKKADSQTAFDFFRDICLGTPGHGLPATVQTDNGDHFDGHFSAGLASIGVKHHRSKPHHAQSNAKDERGHAILGDLISTMLPRGQITSWPKLLPLLQFFKNSRGNRSLGGLSPYEVMHGRKAAMPLDVITGAFSDAPSLTPEAWVTLINATQQRSAIDSTLSVMRDKLYYDATRSPLKRLVEGDTVLVWYPNPPNKLTSPWQGPYKVVRPMDAHGFYHVAEMQAHGALASPTPVISHRLRHFDMSRTSFAAEAARDCKPGEFVVDAILAHRDHPSQPGCLQFKTRYLYLVDGALERTKEVQPWEPVTILFKNVTFKEYCKANGLSRASIERAKALEDQLKQDA